MRVNDFVLGLIIVALAVAVLVMSASLRSFPGEHYGAALFPSMAAGLMGICGVILAWRGFRQRALVLRSGQGLVASRQVAVNLGVTAVAVVVYLLVFNRIGFLVSTAVLLFILFVLLRVRVITSVAASIVVTLIVAVMFEEFLRVPLPWGVLSPLHW
jgi:putative tricarboxylic transport membrane protein